MIYTLSEIYAYGLIHHTDRFGTTDFVDFHKAGNQIIELAERIKSERAIVAMGE